MPLEALCFTIERGKALCRYPSTVLSPGPHLLQLKLTTLDIAILGGAHDARHPLAWLIREIVPDSAGNDLCYVIVVVPALKT